MKVLSQNDMVEQFMAGTDSGREVTDKVKIPDLAKYFYKLPLIAKNKVKTSQLKLAGLKDLHNRSRAEIANTLLSVLDIQRGVVALQWRIQQDHIDIEYIEGFEQKVRRELEQAELETILTQILKTRKNISAIRWDLGKEYIEVSYLYGV